MTLAELNVPDLDAYLTWRLPALRRSTRDGICDGLRSFLRYLHSRKVVSRDLSRAVAGTTFDSRRYRAHSPRIRYRR